MSWFTSSRSGSRPAIQCESVKAGNGTPTGYGTYSSLCRNLVYLCQRNVSFSRCYVKYISWMARNFLNGRATETAPLMDQAPEQNGQILASIKIVDKTITNGKLAEGRDRPPLMLKVETAYVRFISMRLREGSEENQRAPKAVLTSYGQLSLLCRGWDSPPKADGPLAQNPLNFLCRGWDSNPYALCRTQDFKSCASTNSATPARKLRIVNCKFGIARRL